MSEPDFPTNPSTPAPGAGASHERRTIARILAAVVLVGLLGALAGVVFDGGHAKQQRSPGKPSPTDPAVAAQPRSPASQEERLPTSSTIAQPKAGSSQGGSWVTLAEGVRVFVPADWQVQWSDEDEVNLCSSERTCVYAFVATVKPTTEATEIVLASLDATLDRNNYTQRQVYDVVPLAPGGSIVSFAMVDYNVMFVDNQGSWPLYGRHSALVRQDGLVLVDDVRSSGGGEQFNKELESWGEVLVNTQNDFAGVG